MDFRISDTFLDGLARLTGDEQKAVKTTVFDLQVNPANPGHQLRKLDRAKDKHFWSVRVGSDIRLIVHKTTGSLLVCYVDHHDKAYAWAERRRLEVHPATGAAQLVELRETVKDIVLPRVVEAAAAQRPVRKLFEQVPDATLLRIGVPTDWIADVKSADEDHFFHIAEHLPAEAAEALLQIAAGGEIRPVIELPHDEAWRPAPLQAEIKSPDDAQALRTALEHPDAQRRFRLIENHAELERALNDPWDRWTVFLHPDQRAMVERPQSGPARVSGSAGTGKTIVALHRAVFLARSNPDARILLTTFSEPLANALAVRMRRLLGNEPRLADRIDVIALDTAGEKLYRAMTGAAPKLVAPKDLRGILMNALSSVPALRISYTFLFSEWRQVVDAWSLRTWEAYRDVPRLGRRTRLNEERRRQLWSVFSTVQEELAREGLITPSMMFTSLAELVSKRANPPYDFAVVDEAQDIGVAELRFLAALGRHRKDALFFVGDMGQRIFQQPFSWKSLGVDIRGRSRTLHVNYRTSHQIRSRADKLLGPEVTDADGNAESRASTISVFNGPEPEVLICKSLEQEISRVGEWLASQRAQNVEPHEIGLFVRSEAQLARATRAAEAAGLSYVILDNRVHAPSGKACLGTMHLAKGLEFRAVAVIACDDDVLPLQERIEAVGEDGDLKETYDTERQLLYVACTRARDSLLVSGVSPVSEFLEDMR